MKNTLLSHKRMYDGLKDYYSETVRRGTANLSYVFLMHVYTPSLKKSLDSSANKSKMYQTYVHHNIRKEITVTLQSKSKNICTMIVDMN